MEGDLRSERLVGIVDLERVQGGVCQCQFVIEIDSVGGAGARVVLGEQCDLETHKRAARTAEAEAFGGSAVHAAEVRQLVPWEGELCALESRAGKMRGGGAGRSRVAVVAGVSWSVRGRVGRRGVWCAGGACASWR
jgi:hypothetical protein